MEEFSLFNPMMEPPSLPDLVTRNARARSQLLGLTQKQLTKRGASAGTAHRATHELAPNEPGQDLKLSTLEGLAKALGVSAWALLHPEFNPANPPAFKTENEIEEEIKRRLKERLQPLGGMIGDLFGIEEESGPSGRSRGRSVALGPVKTVESTDDAAPVDPKPAGNPKRPGKKASAKGHRTHREKTRRG